VDKLDILKRILKGLNTFGINESHLAITPVRGKPGVVLPVLQTLWKQVPSAKLAAIANSRWAWPETHEQLELLANRLRTALPGANDCQVISVLALRNWALVAALRVMATEAEIVLSQKQLDKLLAKTDMWDPQMTDTNTCVIWGVRLAWQLLIAAYELPDTLHLKVLNNTKLSSISDTISIEGLLDLLMTSIEQVLVKYKQDTEDALLRKDQIQAELSHPNTPPRPMGGYDAPQVLVRISQFNLEIAIGNRPYLCQFEPFDPRQHPTGQVIYLVRRDQVYFAQLPAIELAVMELRRYIRQVVTDAIVVEILDTNLDVGIMTRINGQTVIATESSVVMVNTHSCTILEQIDGHLQYPHPEAPPIGHHHATGQINWWPSR
jgi:hypothetical protein